MPADARKALKTGHKSSFCKGNFHLQRKFPFVERAVILLLRRGDLTTHPWRWHQLNLHDKSYQMRLVCSAFPGHLPISSSQELQTLSPLFSLR